MRSVHAVLLGMVLAFALQANAHAYLDPGTGTYILWLLISGAVGALYAVKLYWSKIRSFFGGERSGKEQDSTAKQDGDDQA